MSRKVLTGMLLSAAVVTDKNDLTSCKRSDLPIYVTAKSDKTKAAESVKQKEPSAAAQFVQQGIHDVRVGIQGVCEQVQKYEDLTKGYWQEAKQNTDWLVNYLGDENNQTPKAPAIVLGGLAGFVLGLRGGFFRKLIFTSAGGLGMASICYPNEAQYYGKIAKQDAEKYATIGYNFLYGGNGKSFTKNSLICPPDSCPKTSDECPLPAACHKCECNCGAIINDVDFLDDEELIE